MKALQVLLFWCFPAVTCGMEIGPAPASEIVAAPPISAARGIQRVDVATVGDFQEIARVLQPLRPPFSVQSRLYRLSKKIGPYNILTYVTSISKFIAIDVSTRPDIIEHLVATHEKEQMEILRHHAESMALLIPEYWMGKTPDVVVGNDVVELKTEDKVENTASRINQAVAQIDEHSKRHRLEGGTAVIALQHCISVDEILGQLNGEPGSLASRRGNIFGSYDRLEIYVVAGPEIWLFVRDIDGVYRIAEMPASFSGWRRGIVGMRGLYSRDGASPVAESQ